MEHSGSKHTGRLLQIIGVVLFVIGSFQRDRIIAYFGVAVALIGRIIEVYWDEWFH